MHKNTITPEELVKNLEILRGRIARKPADYIPRTDFPHSIEDSFSTYIRTRHVDLILSLSDFLRYEFGWPFPYFVLFLSRSTTWVLTAALPLVAWLYIRLSFESLFDRTSKDKIIRSYAPRVTDKGMVKLVRVSSSRLFRRWMNSTMLEGHHQQLMELKKVYVRGYWYSCVTATFPLLDYICRELLHTNNLTKGIGDLCKLFSNARISLESLRPGSGAWDYAKKTGTNGKGVLEKDLRLVGVALESFLQFATIYYGHCDQDEGVMVLNRHAVLHGAKGRIWTKEDATKLLLFLDLMYSLVPVFEILLTPCPSAETAHW